MSDRYLRAVALAALAVLLPIAGCSTSAPAPAAPEHGRFHHVHLNVSDLQKTSAFYEKVFGVVPVSYGGKTPALMAERAFIFLNQTAAPIPSQLQTGIIHIGWSGIDGPGEFAWWQKQGIEFYTPLTKFLTGEYMYLYGPDREVIEIWTNQRHHRFNHVHMLAIDPKVTAEWFADVIHSASPAELGPEKLGNWQVVLGDVGLHIFPDLPAFKPKERTGAILPTDGTGIDHIAFSFRNLDAALMRVKASGAVIETPMQTEAGTGLKHFFLRAPNGVRVEMVEAKPMPDASWE